jgi:hypothetical protein
MVGPAGDEVAIMTKRKRQPDEHTIVARGKGTWASPLIRCACGTRINEGDRLTADELFQIHRHAASLIAERNRPMARWRPGPAPERPHTPTADRTAS